MIEYCCLPQRHLRYCLLAEAIFKNIEVQSGLVIMHAQASGFMTELMDSARLPKTEILVHVGVFNEFIQNAPDADLNIFGLDTEPRFGFMEKMVNDTDTTCLFVRDSGLENILA